MSLRSITVDEIQKWVNDLHSEGKARTTIEKLVQTLFSVLIYAQDTGRLNVLPKRRLVKLPRELNPHTPTFLTIEEIGALLGACDDHHRDVIFAAVFTGLRWGELAGLQASDIDYSARTLRVQRQLIEVKGTLEFSPPKTDNSVRTIHLSDELVSMFRSRNRIGDTLMFVGPDGAPLRNSNFRRRVFDPAVKNAGISKPVTFHDLRHTHASLLIEQGESPKYVQERLGHGDIRTTLDIYVHLRPGHGRDAADRLSGRITEALRHSGVTA